MSKIIVIKNIVTSDNTVISSEFNPTSIVPPFNPRDLIAIARRNQSSGQRDTVAGQALKFPPRGGHEKAL